jgi:hypothetical protein
MTNDRRRKSLAFLGISLLTTLFIAAGLPRLEFQAGIPLPGWENQSETLLPEPVTLPLISINIYFRAVLGVILVLVLSYCTYKVIRGADWKEILRSLRFSAILGLLLQVVIVIMFALAHLPVTDLPAVPAVPPQAVAVNGPVLEPLPPVLIWLVWIGLGLVLALMVVWITHWLRGRKRNRDPLSMEAERALQALKSGESFKNVIVRCYQEMSQVLQREQGLKLEAAMTAHEFERLLEARGIPHTPIDQLTRLFEAARYGYRPPTSKNEEEAFDCLNAIVLHIRKQKKVHLR